MKKCTVWFMALLLSFTFFSLDAEAAGLKDLQPSDQFYEEISYLVDKGVISGYADGTFKPGKAVTRGDAAIMIGRLLDLNGTQRTTKFKDVGKSSIASGYIASAVDKGIIKGYTDSTFRPNVEISRGDMAIILSRAFELEGMAAFRYTDVSESMTASGDIRKISLASITAGYPDGTFRPDQHVTRAQFSAFLARGAEVEFQQKAAIKDSYAWDKTKQYTFSTSDGGNKVLAYKEGGKLYGVDIGYAWESYDVVKDEANYYYLDESYEGLALGYPTSEYEVLLYYPLTVGKTWETYPGELKVTGVNQTVTTPFKTFTGAVEVTDGLGHKEYYVKNIGSVKNLNPDGSVASELIDMK